ncbi:MAG: Gx transporter family protein [Fervidobacterium sp.]|nr:Gx transporter family protein [Fervidobacterium sp.]
MCPQSDDNRIQKFSKERRRTDVVIFGVFTALSSVVYVVEGLIPFPVPGGKWGFSNFLVLYFSYYENIADGVLLAVLKSLIGSVLSGTFLTPGFFMGFLGSLSAAFFQGLASKSHLFSIVGVSIIGMVTNNITQFLVGSVLIGSSAIYGLLPVVMLLGIFSAVANSYLAKQTNDIRSSKLRIDNPESEKVLEK